MKLFHPLLLILLLLISTGCEKKNAIVAATTGGDCDIQRNDLKAEAVTVTQGTDLVMLNGRKITPVGKELYLGTFPIGAALSSTGLLAVQSSGHGDEGLPNRATLVTAATRDHQAIDIIDTNTWVVKWTVPVLSSFVGIAWSPDAKKLYVSGGGRDRIRIIDFASGTPMEVTGVEVEGYPVGLVINNNGNRLYVALMHAPGVAELDLSASPVTVVRVLASEAAPYMPLLSPDEKTLYVSNWGTDTVSRIELASGKSTPLTVGKNPEGLAVSADGKTLWVAASDEDTVSEIDTVSWKVRRLTDLRDNKKEALGRSPTDLLLDASRDRLYVVLANENAIQVIKASTGEKLGLLPTAFYPTEVELNPANGDLFSISAKGFGAGPNANKEAIYRMIRGTAHRIPFVDDAGLKNLTTQVLTNNRIGSSYYSAACAVARNPVPLRFGDKSPIKHVVYIMRENKTYDALLGDLGPARKGDPNLVMFGKRITPNLHKLADEFASLTNFYSESEQSVQGHIWAGNGWVNDFSEKTWIAMWGRPGEAQIILPGIEKASAPKMPDLFTQLSQNGFSVQIYGEYSGIVDDLKSVTAIVDWKFPTGFGIDDRVKAEAFIRIVRQSKLADFSFIALGNDHTFGYSPGRPTPEYMVADNDEATGRIIDALSRSPYWKETVVFVFEDDPQSTADHIDAHRSIGIVASPYTRNVGDVDTHYSNPSVHKTMALLLGAPPISRHAQIAAAMYDAFRPQPDLTPFAALPSNIPYKVNPDDGSKLAEASKKLDFSGVDRAPGLGAILWEGRRGTEFPAHLAGKEDDDDE